MPLEKIKGTDDITGIFHAIAAEVYYGLNFGMELCSTTPEFRKEVIDFIEQCRKGRNAY